MKNILIRRANESDAPSLGRMGATLLKTHYSFDQKRFMAPQAKTADGYAWFLSSQLEDKDSVIFVAERDEGIIGYVYARLEPRSWEELREPAGFIHDVFVEESSRRLGAARLLMEAAMDWLRAQGAPRVLLGTAEHNVAAQRLFDRLGFRRTMIEMTRELE
jgi:ribosomal protein S18 acetylase RimI-like enzyme